MNLSAWIDRHAEFTPEKVAVSCEATRMSYRELALAVSRLAAALVLNLDVRPGDRVAYLGYNSPELLVLLFACARTGAVLLPLNWRMNAPEHAFIFIHARPKAVFVQDEFIGHAETIMGDIPPLILVHCGAQSSNHRSYDELIRADNPRLGADTASGYDTPVLLCYTSGTTGTPKGAVLNQGALFWNAINSTHMHDLTSRDVVLTILPMFHVGGLNMQTVPALHAGASVVLHRRFEPSAFFDCLEQQPVTLSLLVPTILVTLMRHPRWRQTDFSRLRAVGIGSMISPEKVIADACADGFPLYQVYGSTETAPIAAYTRCDDTRRNPRTTGRAALHCRLRIADPENNAVAAGVKGEIQVCGPNLLSSYWEDPAATRAAVTDGWFHTEDIGHLDRDGFLYVDGRTKDMIISGGENIYPAAVENVLSQIPDLAEVTVVGYPDEYWGEIVVAVAVLRDGCVADPGKLLNFCGQHIARYEYPRGVLFVEELPRNAMGKVIKARVRETVAERAAEVIGMPQGRV